VKNSVINIANSYYPCETLGPGTRFCIWVQGCHFNCYKCISSKYQPFEEKQLYSPEKLAEIILAKPKLDGITISGGEPFEQAESLAVLLTLITDKRPELSFICYTGYAIEKLTWETANELLKKLDVLIADPYIHELNNGLGLKGSSNQRIFFLTDKLKQYKEKLEISERELDCIYRDNEIEIIGIPNKYFKLNT
jgi:anaerobic ribonucleoside-triphosphate reductase activating protein